MTQIIKIRLEQALAVETKATAKYYRYQSQISAITASSSSAAQVTPQLQGWIRLFKDYQRYVNLVKDGSVTQQQFDLQQSRILRSPAQITVPHRISTSLL